MEAPPHEQSTEDDRCLAVPSPSESSAELGLWAPTATLIGSALGIIVCTNIFIQSMGDAARIAHVSTNFIATILIPFISNSPEGVAVIAVSRSGNVDFAISIIVGSILQIGLLAIPVLVVFGWIIDQDMTLNFETFHTMIFFFSVLVVSYMLREGSYTYIHGAMLVGL